MAGNRQHIIHGLRDGIPIAMGYFAVTFSLGIIAARAGLTAPMGFLSSFFTRASAGEYGTYTLVAVQAAYVEVIAMCLVANLRYMLMSAALSQKIAPGTQGQERESEARHLQSLSISTHGRIRRMGCAGLGRRATKICTPMSHHTWRRPGKRHSRSFTQMCSMAQTIRRRSYSRCSQSISANGS